MLDRCIKAHTNTKPFIKAREVCEKENAALVKIDSYEMWIFVTTVVCMYRLTAWARWAAARVTNSIRGHAYLCMLCTACFLMFINTTFVGSANTIDICLILSTIYIFIPVSGCIGRTPVY